MREKSNQIGGDHYSKHSIQPFCIIDEYNLDYYEGAALKYLLRHKDKNGKEDLLKLKDYVDCIIDRQYPDKKEIIDGGRAWGKSYWTTSTSNVSFDSIESPKCRGDRATYHGVIVDVYCFKNYLTDEQMKEVTSEWTEIYKEADSLSVITQFTLEELVSIFKAVDFIAKTLGIWYKSSEIADSILNSSKREPNFNKLITSVLWKYVMYNSDGIQNIMMFDLLKDEEKWSMYKDGYVIHEIDDSYTLTIK